MKRICVVLFTVIISNLSCLYGQDIIYTISGTKDGSAVYLDSILFENLDNQTRFLAADLPNQLIYEINLSSKELITSINSYDLFEENLRVVKNVPGEINLHVCYKSIEHAIVNIYNLSGQQVFGKNIHGVEQGDVIAVHIPCPGIYILSINMPYCNKSYKVSGSISNLNASISIGYSTDPAQYGTNVPFEAAIKKSSYADNFTFQTGDSLRVTAFLNGFYTYPQGSKIASSKNIIFSFLKSTAEGTGISDVYKSISNEDYTLIGYDPIDGRATLILTSATTKLLPGDIITLDLDTTGLIQKVVSISNTNGNTIIETGPAYMDDLFINTEFKLSTKLIESQGQLKSTASLKDIMNALTDRDGYIHPVKIVYHDAYNRRIIKSAVEKNGEELSENIIDFYEDLLNTDLYGKSGDNIHFYIDEGYASMKADAVFEFDFTYEGKLTEDTKVKKGDLNYFKFYIEANAGFQTKLALDVNYQIEKENEKKLFNMKKATAHFIVPPSIPVWITFDCDIYGNYHFDADAMLYADWGFESHHNLKAGGIYERSTNNYSPISEYTPDNIVYPLNTEGEVNAFARLELYPRIDVKLYNFFGPYAEFVPFVEGNYNAAIQSQMTLQGNETFLAYNSGINLGLDIRVGTELSFIGLFEEEYGPRIIHCFNTSLWEAPKDIKLLTELPANVEPGTTLELQVKVCDNFNLPLKLCPVYFSGDGTFSKQIAFTDIMGIAKINWSVGEVTGKKTFSATIFKADKSAINTITGSTNIGGLVPIADFISTPITGAAPFTVSFTDQSTNNPISWSWDFGDGATSTQQNPSHTYYEGTYTVSLTATNSYGSNTHYKTNYITVGSKPIANFNASQTNITAGETVQFYDQSANSPTEWIWDLGEGIISTLKNPTCTYTEPGEYTIGLTVSNAYGSDNKYIERYIIVSSGGNIGTVTDIDGNVYSTVTIGTQEWMAENLRTKKLDDESSIPHITDKDTWNQLTTPAYFWPDNDINSVDTYGLLYNWYSVETGKLCPTGWHVPNDNDWTTLITYLGGEDFAAGKLKEAGYEHWYSPNEGATNNSRFTALPGGYYRGSSLHYTGSDAYFWSSTEADNYNACNVSLNYLVNFVFRDCSTTKNYGNSIRCIKDKN